MRTSCQNHQLSHPRVRRARLVILDVEAPDGDLNQAMQAVQSALRPAENVLVMRRAITAPRKEQPAADTAELQVQDENVTDVEQEQETASAAPARSKGAFKSRSPKVIPLDLDSGEMPFAAYVEKTKPDSHAMRNLVVAAWLKKYRGIDEITMDHVYSCYLPVKWPTGMKDFSKPLRALKSRGRMDGKGEGIYTINHVGLSDVAKLGG